MKRSIRFSLLSWWLLALLLAACSGARPASDLPAPVGAREGLNTFIFFYTDN